MVVAFPVENSEELESDLEVAEARGFRGGFGHYGLGGLGGLGHLGGLFKGKLAHSW